jgi:hypothetical protein
VVTGTEASRKMHCIMVKDLGFQKFRLSSKKLNVEFHHDSVNSLTPRVFMKTSQVLSIAFQHKPCIPHYRLDKWRPQKFIIVNQVCSMTPLNNADTHNIKYRL